MSNLKSLLVCFFLSIRIIGFPGDTTTIVIVHVNDMHGNIDKLGKLSTYVKKTKQNNENIFLVSTGDMFTGNPVVDKHPEKGFPIVDLMNKIGFDVAELGNHEFDYGQEILKKRLQQATFPVICSNILWDKSPLESMKPYITLTTKNGIKVLFLGFIQINENKIPDSHPLKVKGINFIDFTEDAIKYRNLKDSTNIFIVLSHLGYESDKALAQILPNLEVIIGGHSHTTLQNPIEEKGKPLIVQTGAYLDYIGKLTIKYYQGNVISRIDTLIKVADLTENDVAIQKEIDIFNADPVLLEPIGVADATIKGVQNLGSMMTDAVTTMLGADIAFQNNGGVRLDSISSGNISKKIAYNLDPFDNDLVLFNLSTDEIKSLIKNSYLKNHKPDLQVSGIKYCIELNPDSTVKNILLTDYKGNTIKEEKMYKVIMNSYISSTYKFDHKGTGMPTNITSSENLISFIKYKKHLKYLKEERVSVKAATGK